MPAPTTPAATATAPPTASASVPQPNSTSTPVTASAPLEAQEVVSTRGTKTLKWFIGYPSAALLPTTSNSISQADIPTGTTLCTLGDLSGAKNIEIYANQLALFGGSTYDFRGKNVSIFAKRLWFLRQGEVFVNVSAVNAPNAPGPGGVPRDPTDATGPAQPWSDLSVVAASVIPSQPGYPGAHGLPGANGPAGGTFKLRAVIDVNQSDQVSLRIEAHGGSGGNGGAGGNGGRGGNGLTTTPNAIEVKVPSMSDTDLALGTFIWRALIQCQPGSAGGLAGRGGPGGDDGVNGTIDITYGLTIAGKPSTTGLQMKGTILPGSRGEDGKNGLDGPPGKPGNLEVFTVLPSKDRAKWEPLFATDPTFVKVEVKPKSDISLTADRMLVTAKSSLRAINADNRPLSNEIIADNDDPSFLPAGKQWKQSPPQSNDVILADLAKMAQGSIGVDQKWFGQFKLFAK